MKRYLIILNANSTIGAMYLNGNNDGLTTDGNTSHPVLSCTEINLDNTRYIFATRPFGKEDELCQSVYLPHDSVVAIYQLAGDEKPPFGFAQS